MAAPEVSYTRAAIVREVIDGDTVALDVDLGFRMWARLSCRLAGIDAPEHDTPAGQAAKAFLSALLPAGTPVVVDSLHTDKYGGRFDAGVWVGGQSVNTQLVQAGHAKAWKVGKEPKPYALRSGPGGP
jgi:endonuclease YncB( thermonuclease family)